MDKNYVQNIFSKYNTDKARHENYCGVYAEIFNSLTPQNILEFGVWKGESLYAWAELFPNSLITGVDLLPPKYYCDNSCGFGGSHSVTSDKCVPCKKLIQNNRIKFIQQDYTSMLSLRGKFDLIIDDADHTLENQILSLNYLKYLTSNGVMVIEDVNVDNANAIQEKIPESYSANHYDLRGLPDEYLIVIKRKQD